MRTCFFGAMWPARMIGRGDWSALLWNADTVIAQFIIPSYLIADGSPEFHRELTTRPRFLSPERTRTVRALQGSMFDAFAGIEHGAPDVERLKPFHRRMLEMTFEAFREACGVTGVEYPADSEAAFRSYFTRELGLWRRS